MRRVEHTLPAGGDIDVILRTADRVDNRQVEMRQNGFAHSNRPRKVARIR